VELVQALGTDLDNLNWNILTEKFRPELQEAMKDAVSIQMSAYETSAFSIEFTVSLRRCVTRLQWTFYRNTVEGSLKSPLQCCGRISTIISMYLEE
jgi:hypothetical protein